jgi:hypothetical protein
MFSYKKVKLFFQKSEKTPNFLVKEREAYNTCQAVRPQFTQVVNNFAE